MIWVLMAILALLVSAVVVAFFTRQFASGGRLPVVLVALLAAAAYVVASLPIPNLLDVAALERKVADKLELSGEILAGQDMTNASLAGGSFSGSDFFASNLSGADLAGAQLEGANLSRANLSNANLAGARASGAVFNEALVSAASFAGADLRGADLRGVQGLVSQQLLEADMEEGTTSLPAYLNFDWQGYRDSYGGKDTSLEDKDCDCSQPEPGEPPAQARSLAFDTLMIRGINFEPGESALDANDRATVDELALVMLANPELRVEIDGHTDSTGASPENLALGEARAMAVRKRLMMSLPADRILISSQGEKVPLADNADVAGRVLNRRVELKLRGEPRR